VLRQQIDKRYIDGDEVYKCKDFLYILSAKDIRKKNKIKEIKVDIYDGDAYEIKREIIRKNNISFIKEGVDIVDVDSTYIDYGCTIKEGTIIYPNSYIKNNSKIGARCSIKGIVDGCTIKDNVKIDDSRVENSIVDENVNIGPYSYVHDDCLIKVGSFIGSYVELKKTIIGCRCKVKHQSVLLDCIIGDDVNVGAGVISANYDGKMKHISSIGNSSFIGCNSVIISPIKIGDNCFVAADTTITKNIEDNYFTISRVPQVNKCRINKVM
jgi:bifunctional UDP-N-acetylglucosamine pyrophosphorylase/glucosamine-1-phosphate N-acetyltransferase